MSKGYKYGEGVRVSKEGGAVDVGSPQLMYPDPKEISILIKEQENSIQNSLRLLQEEERQAEIQRQLESEARELIAANQQRLMQADSAVLSAEQELNLAIDKERQFEMKRVMAHEDVQRREHERAQAKAAQVLLVEEIKEAEKLSRIHETNRIIAMNKAKTREIEIKEAELKIQSINLRSQLPTTPMQLSQPAPVRIEVEVPTRSMPEQRLFSEAGQEGLSTVAAAEIKERVPAIPVSSAETVTKKKKKSKKSSYTPSSESVVVEGGETVSKTTQSSAGAISSSSDMPEAQKTKKTTGFKKMTGMFRASEQQ